MKIPVEQLEADTLYNLVEAYVLREGTDYGDVEVALEQKVEQVIEQLKCGDAILMYSELHETVNIVSKQEFAAMAQETDSEEEAQ